MREAAPLPASPDRQEAAKGSQRARRARLHRTAPHRTAPPLRGPAARRAPLGERPALIPLVAARPARPARPRGRAGETIEGQGGFGAKLRAPGMDGEVCAAPGALRPEMGM